MSANQETVAVIGAGMVGVSTAIWLQRTGFKVILIDRVGVAGGTSYGNAGILACSAIIPVTTPGFIFKIPKMLFDPDQPLFLRWSYLPKILPWLVKFLSKANLKDMQQITADLHQIMYDSVDQHKQLAQGTGAEDFIKSNQYIHGYDNRDAFLEDLSSWETRKKVGLSYDELSQQELAEHDPALAGKFGFAIRSLTDGHVTDPGEYIKTLASHFKNQGGEIIIDEAVDVPTHEGWAIGVQTANGRTIDANHVVIASGAWSGLLANKLGLKVPLETERGYHVEFVNPNIELKSPVMVSAGKFGINSMNGRMRCAGIVELGGLEAAPSQAPFELLKRQAHTLFPELEYDEVREWMGHRPSTPDSLPLIGALENVPNVWAGFGHQHLGLTGGPKTGLWLAQLISGKTPNEDLSAYRPNRF